MKYIQDHEGKEIPYYFDTKTHEQEYIKACNLAWNCVPRNVSWAMGTEVYQQKLLLITNKTNYHDNIPQPRKNPY